MTRLTDIAKHVTEPDPADLLYIVDVSDLSDGPSGSSGFTTPADLLRNTPLCYASRAEAEAAQVPAGAAHILVGTLAYREDPAGTALTTADGRNWSPDGRVTYEHWGAVGDGVTDDSDAIIACHRWCLFNRATCEPIGATYAVTKRILTYDVAADGPGLEFHLRGAGKGQTVFRIAGHISDSLFYITGDTSAPNRSRAINCSFSDFQVVSDGLVDADVFRIDIATSIEFHDVGIYNCRGTALRARELWDSQIEISVVECGDDGTGTGPGTRNKYAIEIDNYFGVQRA
ncbi:MAG: hypothetical protein KatS3mg118_0217 [Paracoccaceae bacterium]|nr:MAG: hypothetical protein KatS3mg118_0217 [Paracoccaceae bacterium]